MRKALIPIGILGVLLSSLSIAEGSPQGKTFVDTRSASAIVRAKVRLVHRAEESKALLPIVQQPDIHPDDQMFLDRVLRQAPALCRENIEQLVVRYDPRAERGQATASTMILRGPLASLPRREQSEMVGVIFHECGHISDLGALQGSPRSGKSAYPDGNIPTYTDDPSLSFYAISWEDPTTIRSDAAKEDFVSGYAKESDAFEDLAESFVYFALHEQAFRERAENNSALARKLAWMETYIFKNAHPLLASESWDGTIAWDVTKLPGNLDFMFARATPTS